MNGVDNYNEKYDLMSKKRIMANNDKSYLEGFYYYLLSDTSYSGAYGYLGCVINFVDYCSVKKLSTIKLDNYTKYLSSIKTKSSSYKIEVYSALKKFSRYLKANGYSEDYMQFVKRPKFKESQETKEKREIGYMTEDEVAKFLNNIKKSNKPSHWKSRDLAMASVLLNTGIRCSALQKLDVNDIDFNKNTITVYEKGDVSRKIFISDSVANVLKNWMIYRENVLNGKNDSALFVSSQKRRVDKRTIYNIIKEYGSVIDGKNITPHKTRATYGTLLYSKTHDLYFVQERMGHSNPKTTEVYIRGNHDSDAKQAAEIMGNIIDF